MFKYLTQKWKQKRGFTLMEVMVVVAILAVIAGIAIPSVINMRKNMKFTERNDYAKAIFMAAQANLTEMRSKGELDLLQSQAETDALPANTFGAPTGYFYTYNEKQNSYALVLPVNSVESSVRNEQVIIEYNPKAGIVYSVFYYEGNSGELRSMYTTPNKISRSSEEARKELLVGYYSVGNVDALDAKALNVRQISSSLSYSNTQEGILTVTVPILDTKYNNIFANLDSDESEEVVTPSVSNNDYSRLISGLEITLLIVGENGGTFPVTFTGSDPASISYFTHDITNFAVTASFPLDSLKSNGSFSEIESNKNDAGGKAIASGDNVTITAEVTYTPTPADPIIIIESSTIAGINPMFHSLTQNPEYDAETAKNNVSYAIKPYILAISNARHLQNLQHLDGAFADANIESIVFVAQTEEDAVTNSGGSNSEEPSTPGSDPAEPSDGAEKARAAGTPNGNEASDSPSTSAENTKIAIDWAGNGTFKPITFSTDYEHPKIIGNGVEIHNLKISETGNSGSPAGLFAKLDGANVDGITLVDSDITNASAFLTGDLTGNIDKVATTGALVGTAKDATITNCNVIHSKNYTAKEDDAFAIEGRQFVGGLVGYTAGNTTIKNCSVTVEVADTGIVSGETDNITYQLGGMVGYADGTTFENCTTTATVTATTATDLGGMAGKAENASFTGCSTEATVTGADGVLSNIGGLVGEASNVAFTNCDSDCEDSGKDGAIILSGPNAGDSDHKQRVGGLVGLATGGNFTNCTSNTGTEVTSAENALSDIGGMVGYADDVEFTNCESRADVTGTQSVDASGNAVNTIPNNNLGGMVGYSKNSTFNGTVDVTMAQMPQFAGNAGGLIGYMNQGSIESNASINLTGLDSSSDATIERFGGLAGDIVNGTVHSADDSHYITITLKGTFKAEQAAGATVGMQSSNISDIKVLMNNAVLQGTSAAGLAIEAGGTIDNCRIAPNDGTATVYGGSSAGFIVKNSADITNSYMRGTVSVYSGGQGAGFVIDNNASIERCMANISLSSGNTFVKTNNGTVKDCYGFLWGNDSTSALKIDSKCSYSYFINGETDAIVMYEGLKKGSDDSTAATKSSESDNIKDTAALADPWALELLNKGTATNEKPAWSKGSNGYPYPELSFGHFGSYSDPAVGAGYEYYIAYKETYSDGTEGTYTISSEHENKLDYSSNKAIESTSYVIYCRTGQLGNLGDAFDAKTYDDDNKIPRLYTRYTQKQDKHYIGTITINGQDIYLNTYCAPGGRIRTGEQFANTEKDDDGTFKLDRNITVDSTLSSFSGTLTNNGDYTITTTVPLINEFSGTLSGLKVDATITSSSGTCGVLTNTMNSGSISACKISGKLDGNGDKVGGAIGEIKGGKLKDVSTSIDVTATGTNVGVFAGYIGDGTLENCDSTADNGQRLPFAYFKTKDITGANYFSKADLSSRIITESYFTNNELVAIEDGASTATIIADVDSSCTFTLNGNSGTKVISETKYYYDIPGTRNITNGSATSCTVQLERITPKYSSFVRNEGDEDYSESDGNNPVAYTVETNYFIGTGTTYNKMYVYIEKETKTESEDKTTDYYKFVFTDSTSGSAAYEKTVTITQKELDTSIPEDIVKIYKYSDQTLPSHDAFSGYYQIHIDNGEYLTHGVAGNWGSNSSAIETVWRPCDGNTWGSFLEIGKESTISASFGMTTGDKIGGAVTITINTPDGGNGWVTTTRDVKSLHISSVAIAYDCTFIGTAYEVYVPNS